MLARGQSLLELLRPRVSKSEQPDDVDARVREDWIRSFVDGSPWNVAACELPCRGIDVINRRNFPELVLLHCGYKAATHPPISENSRPESLRHSPQFILGGSTRALCDSHHTAM